MADVEIKVVTVDTTELFDAICQDLGYRDFADLMSRHEAAQAKLDPGVREVADEIDKRVERKMIFGDEVLSRGASTSPHLDHQ